MSWCIETEAVTANKTRMFLREDSAESYWEVETITEPHRSWLVVRFNGWHVLEISIREFIEGLEIRWHGKPTMTIPAEVLSHLPQPMRFKARQCGEVFYLEGRHRNGG